VETVLNGEVRDSEPGNQLVAEPRAHTNTLVIGDRGFPFWKDVETVDISLVDDLPKVLDVLAAIRANFIINRAFMAEEFNKVNSPETISNFRRGLDGILWIRTSS